ncbi:cation-transporting P-type ATPase [Chitiniphilus eburneus]|uniref:Cation-transporting P-type ATPase n=1 Tax=Chitiniphilus eburneus TaxID=2571148 RepID=A0A4U0Q035_9NEIS|nr:cation-transporting P-type ATPase [Chitiniphilus eburneus]TJZ74257.1 cation-transporting P-type ATPase [Chitiniphilus eburneus]
MTRPVPDPNAPPTWHQLDIPITLTALETSAHGLSAAEAAARLARHGPNVLPEQARRPGWLRFLLHFNDVLIYILLGACVVTGAMGHWVDTMVILGVAVINALIGFIQENSAEKSLQSIRDMLSSQTLALRDGKTRVVATADLVPGDVVSLRPGDKIPADLRLLQTHSLRVEEAILTGESSVVEKHIAAIPGDALLGDRRNMAFSGTTVSAGNALGIVVATAGDTELGHINRMISTVSPIQTPLLQQTKRLGQVIFIMILAMMAVLFFWGWLAHDMPFGQLLLALISLAVAAVPEGLPAVISIILSLGVQKMARSKAIIRKLPTVETLGAMTIVCSDKTGTLTMNEMTVKSVVLGDRAYTVAGESYEPVGEIREVGGQAVGGIDPATPLGLFITAVDLCNDTRLRRDSHGRWQVVGAPTAGALKVLAAKAGIQHDGAKQHGKIPFDSAYKYQATHHELNGRHYLFMIGAPDVIAARCATELHDDGQRPFAAAYWEDAMARQSEGGLRMLAAAYREIPAGFPELDHPHLEQGLVFLGFAGMMDPPRPEATEAIALCRTAGIRVKMITGDHPGTAMAIGAMMGIGNGQDVVTGQQLEALDDEALVDVADRCDIFARTSPEHKLRLVRALQRRGNVVGMTGDGVNDAPALKQADVGIAMGIKGTEVTREAADMVLADDNFATIARAVKEGRRVYDNLKKTIHFILPTNLGQGLLVVVALLTGAVIPLTPLQILWMNMATSTTLSFGLAFEPAEPGLMHRRPRDPARSILDGYAIWRVALVGTLLAASAFILESQLLALGKDTDFVRTVLLQTLVATQWVYMFNCRIQDRFSLDLAMFRSKGLWLATGVLAALQLAIVHLPFMNDIFGTTPLPFLYWLLSLKIALLIFAVIELEKWITRQIRARRRP